MNGMSAQSKMNGMSAQSKMSAKNGNGMPDTYLMFVKMEKCGHCVKLQQMFDQLRSAGQLTVNPYVLQTDELEKNTVYLKLAQQAWSFYPGSEGAAPLLMIVRKGRVAKEDMQLGSTSMEALQQFLKRF